jgi:hypothetical protein
MLFLIQKLQNWLNRKSDVVASLTAENLVLRQQLIVLKRNQARPSLKVRDRGRPDLSSEVKSLVLKLSIANPLWGAPKYLLRDRDKFFGNLFQ